MLSSERPALILDQNHKVVNVNSPWLLVCGFTKEEMMGNGMHLIQGPETFQGKSGRELKRLMKACKGHHAVQATLRNYTKTKSPITNHVSVAPCTAGSEVHFLCISDITTEREGTTKKHKYPMVSLFGAQVMFHWWWGGGGHVGSHFVFDNHVTSRNCRALGKAQS
jgi:PAS domain S-box-containing protein